MQHEGQLGHLACPESGNLLIRKDRDRTVAVSSQGILEQRTSGARNTNDGIRRRRTCSGMRLRIAL